FEELASRHDVRAVWLGLAAARRAKGDTAGAAGALARALSGHAAAVDAAFRTLADDIAAAAGAPGWCAIGENETLAVGPLAIVSAARGAGAPVIALDERPIRLRLPPVGRLRLPGTARADRLDATIGGRALLGSPIELAALRRTEGCVAATEAGLEGWAWLPGNPDVDPVLRIEPAGGGPGFTVTAADATMETWSEQPLVRPRQFSVPVSRIAGWRAPIRVLGQDGRDILGSPLDPRIAARGTPIVVRPTPPRPAVVRRVRRGATVIVPVYRGCDATLRCIETVRATVPRGTRIVVVDDASPEPKLAGALDALARRGRIGLIRHQHNRGFPASANAGMRAAEGRDAVLLNSDTLVAAHWLERLRDVAYAATDIGTVTPLSNDAGIVNYPALGGGNPVPDRAATERLAALAHRANAGGWVEIPTAVGFCMYIRGDCLEAVGPLREGVFAQGYGEENDFCMRARRLGWRHLAACGVFVAHVGAQSFGAARAHLMARNLAVLNQIYPGYHALIAAHEEADPLADARRRIDFVRWRADRARGARGAVLLVTHDRGGGVQRQVEARIARLRAADRRPIVLRPVLPDRGTSYAGVCQVDDGFADSYPNLQFTLPRELGSLARLLRGDRIEYAEVHHLLGHDHAVLDLCRALGVPYEVHVHDYAWFCPRISLLGPDRRYCGEPEAARCEICVREGGRSIEEDISVAALRRRSAADLAGARRVVAPSADAARRIGRHFPAIDPRVEPWEEAIASPSPPPPANAERRVCVIGAIGPEKGYDILLAAARDAARRRLPLRFIVVGHTVDDAELLRTGRVFVTGEYRDSEATALIRAQQADIAWLPSIWPETWCFALSEAWRAGLEVVAFDIGALAERIRDRGRGTLLPLGLPPGALNDVLLGAPSRTLAAERGLVANA
ncbi:MAG: glycosyltransferase, partial [Alphaproteobacteria bacterium]|nr:glycosyltransferase [Alphaproteobacteria bacterium]